MMLRGILELLAKFIQPTVEPPRGLSRADAEADFIDRYGMAFKQRDLPPADGRYFIWYRTRNGMVPCAPAIIHDEKIGPKVEFIGPKHVLSPEEYDDSFTTLAARYPAPAIERE
jgi:hypothetical protein